jgi:phage tail P2-like protein
MGWYSDNIYNKFLAEQVRGADLDDDMKQFVEVMALSLDEFDDNVRSFSDIWDIDICPAKYLPYLAHLIGWHFGPDDEEISKREQLKIAIPFYKKKGLEESFRILCYTYGFLIDVIPLWTRDYEIFLPDPDDPLWPGDDPPLVDQRIELGGSKPRGEGLYPTPHVGIELSAVVGGFFTPTTFWYMLERLHDIRPAHVVIDWWRLFFDFFDFVDIWDEAENYLDISFWDAVPWPGCFWRGKGCLLPFFRDGTVTDRHGPGGFYPIQDYVVYPPPYEGGEPYEGAVWDAWVGLPVEPGVDLTPDEITVMPPNDPFGGLHVRNPDQFCSNPPLRDDFVYDIAYHLRDGSSFMNRETPIPPGPYFFRDGQFLTTCNQESDPQDNSPWLPFFWDLIYLALADVPETEKPPWEYIPPSGSDPTITIENSELLETGLSQLRIQHDSIANGDLVGWEIPAGSDPIGEVDFRNGYVFDTLIQIQEGPLTLFEADSSVALTVELIGKVSPDAEKKLSIEVFTNGLRKTNDPATAVSYDFTEKTLLRVVVNSNQAVTVLADGQRLVEEPDGVWLEAVDAEQVVRFTAGPMLVDGHTSDIWIEWVRNLVDDVAYGPGRDYWYEYITGIWEGWCCPPDPPHPGSPLRYYCCKEDRLEILPEFAWEDEVHCINALRDGLPCWYDRSGFGGYYPEQDYSPGAYPPPYEGGEPYEGAAWDAWVGLPVEGGVDLTPDTGSEIVGLRNGRFTFSRGCNDPVDLDQDGPCPDFPNQILPPSVGWDPSDGSAAGWAEYENPGHSILSVSCIDLIFGDDTWEDTFPSSPFYGTSSGAAPDSELEIEYIGAIPPLVPLAPEATVDVPAALRIPIPAPTPGVSADAPIATRNPILALASEVATDAPLVVEDKTIVALNPSAATDAPSAQIGWELEASASEVTLDAPTAVLKSVTGIDAVAAEVTVDTPGVFVNPVVADVPGVTVDAPDATPTAAVTLIAPNSSIVTDVPTATLSCPLCSPLVAPGSSATADAPTATLSCPLCSPLVVEAAEAEADAPVPNLMNDRTLIAPAPTVTITPRSATLVLG